MKPSEGVIRYDLAYRPTPPLEAAGLPILTAWRSIMHRAGMIGRDARRYGGFGYGNISCRRRGRPQEFIISASQTGHLIELSKEHYCLVQHADIHANRVVACGPRPPSSEALTHAAIYQKHPATRAVIHAHCPEIWRQARRLNLPRTRSDALYGTPDLALDIQRLLDQRDRIRGGVLVMGGHMDGIVSFGASLRQCACRLLQVLARALAAK